MKNRTVLTKILIVSFFMILIQDSLSAQTSEEYVYVAVTGRLFSKKLNVAIDFGDKTDQIIKSEKYSEVLNGRKSYIGVLNYMFEEGYELVETMEFTSMSQGTGGTSGLGFILKRKRE